MVNMLHREICVNDGLCVLNAATSTQDKEEDKQHGKPPKNSKMCKDCWTKMIRKHINNSPSNWALVNILFTVSYERWERFRRLIGGYHMS